MGCIESTYAPNGSGYPVKEVGGKTLYHHRLVAGATKGEDSHLSRLSEFLVKEIRSVKGEMSSREAAALFGCSKTNILDIWKRKIWKHVA